jgi:hypothetical protein
VVVALAVALAMVGFAMVVGFAVVRLAMWLAVIARTVLDFGDE